MMWIFLLSDTFIFSCFLLSYMTARMSTTVPWPNPSEVFALNDWRAPHPSHPDRHHDLRPDQQQRDAWRWPSISVTAVIASRPLILMLVTSGIRRNVRRNAGVRMDQADHGGRAALRATRGARRSSAQLLHDHWLPRHPRDDRRDFPDRHRAKGLAGRLRCVERRGFFTSRKGHYEIVEITGLYWHFVDLVWVFIFAFFLSLVRSAHDRSRDSMWNAQQPSLHGHVHEAAAGLRKQGSPGAEMSGFRV